jgi:hypothetical protein
MFTLSLLSVKSFLPLGTSVTKTTFFKNTKNTLYKNFQIIREGDLWAHVIDYQSVFKLKTIDL